MRSFEFAEGGSAKFWQIERDGVDVTVRWGRSGTNGQTKSKTFGTAADAAAHEAKLIAEKLRKGYAETSATTAATGPTPTPAAPAPVSASTAPVPAATPAAADEDSFVFPAGWHRHRHARRASCGIRAFRPDPQAPAVVAEEVARRPGQMQAVLDAPSTDPAVRRAARAWQAAEPDAEPVGAAATAMVAGLGNWNHRDRLIAAADLWVAERGVCFAAQAAVELMSLLLIDDNAPTGPRSTRNDRYGVRHLRPGESRQGWHADLPLQVLLRVREALAAASDAEYTDTIAALTRYRAAHPYARLATSVLAPEQREWVEQDVAAAVADNDGYRATALITAAGTPEQADALVSVLHAWVVVGSLALLTTFVDGLGVAAVPTLFHWLDAEAGDAESQRRLLTVLAALPGDAAMQGLVDRVDVKYVVPALLEAAERYPVRALRLLAESAGKPAVDELLRAHLLAHTDLVEQVRPPLSTAAAARVERIVRDAAAVVFAPLSAVPPLLADPPWRHRTKPVKPVVLDGLACTDAATVSWLPGEQEAWRDTPFHRYGNHCDFEHLAKRLRDGLSYWYDGAQFLADAPEDLARPMLAVWRPDSVWEVGAWMRVVAARFGLDALPLALDLARRSPADTVEVLAPYASPELAVLMADSLARLKTARRAALAWLLRHPAAAARALVPPALGKAGTGRRQAESVLLTLHTNGHTDAVRAAGQAYGAAAAAAIETLLATDPLAVLPPKLPPVPAWAVPGLLPPVLLRDGSGALPAEAVGNLITVLALSRAGEPYAGLEIVRQACEPASLAEFGWGLFQRWQSSGAAAKENWVLDTLALIGDDETVRRLTPLILAWPGEGGHAKAVTGVGVLAAIGTDVALMHLHGIAQRAKFKGLKTAAGQKMAEVAAGLGLSAEQLADRLVPDFGLDADGSLRLDYGPRQFVVGFDEQLRPYVADSAGKRLKALPKPGVRDDAGLAPAAYQRFTTLKKDVRTIATDQVRRLERAMVAGRRWTGAEFRQLFAGHPLLWHIVRRLVWGIYDADGAPVGAIRVAEDRSFSTVDDEETALADDAVIGVAHPLHLGDTRSAWAELFADYEILQPFPQLSRETYALTPDEAASSRLTRFENITLPVTKVLGLERRGWTREQPQDAGVQSRMELVVAPRREVAVELDPGIAVGAIDVFPEQKIVMVLLHDGTGGRWISDTTAHVPLGRLDPVAASEILRDLTELTA